MAVLKPPEAFGQFQPSNAHGLLWHAIVGTRGLQKLPKIDGKFSILDSMHK